MKKRQTMTNLIVPLANMGKCFSFIISRARTLMEAGFPAADSTMHWLPASDSAIALSDHGAGKKRKK